MTKLTYIGHSAFQLEADGKSVLVDPFITGNPMATVPASDFSPQTILLTHAHNDHVGDTVEIAQANRCGGDLDVRAWRMVGEARASTPTAGNHGGTVAFDGGTAKIHPGLAHVDRTTTTAASSPPAFRPVMIVRFGGTDDLLRRRHLPLRRHETDRRGGLDVAVLPIGDHFTMGPPTPSAPSDFLEPHVRHPLPLQHLPADPAGRQPVQTDGRRANQRPLPSCLHPGESPRVAKRRWTPFNEELQRTAYQKKAVSKIAPNAVLDLAIAFFKERGYRAGRTGRPNQVFIMGGAEGGLPRVTGEVTARADVGKAGRRSSRWTRPANASARPCGSSTWRCGSRAGHNRRPRRRGDACVARLRGTNAAFRQPGDAGIAPTNCARRNRVHDQSKKSRSSSVRYRFAASTLRSTPIPGRSQTSMKPSLTIGLGRPSTMSYHHSGLPIGYSKAM